MSSEHRLVRPYLGVEGLQKVLDNSYLSIGPASLSDRESLFLSPVDYLTRPVSLVFGRDGANLQQVITDLFTHVETLGLEPADVEFLVLISTSRLKISEIVWRLPVDQAHELPSSITIATGSTRPAPLHTPVGGCRLDVYLALRRELTPHPLRPWRKGTWLAHVSFAISTELGEIGFTPIPLDDDRRAELGVPPGTNRVVVIDGSTIDPDFPDDDLQLYVDVDLLTELDLYATTPGARAFQRQLFLDVANAIVMNASRFPDFINVSISEIEGSLMHKLVALVAGKEKGETEDQAFARQTSYLAIAQNDPLRFVAHLESLTQDRRDLSGSLTANETP